MKVLWMEDHADCRRMYAALLRHMGDAVTTAADPAEANTLLSKMSFDVVVADALCQQDCIGYEFARSTSQQYPGLRVLVYSGALDAGEATRALLNGVYDCVDIRGVVDTFAKMFHDPGTRRGACFMVSQRKQALSRLVLEMSGGSSDCVTIGMAEDGDDFIVVSPEDNLIQSDLDDSPNTDEGTRHESRPRNGMKAVCPAAFHMRAWPAGDATRLATRRLLPALSKEFVRRYPNATVVRLVLPSFCAKPQSAYIAALSKSSCCLGSRAKQKINDAVQAYVQCEQKLSLLERLLTTVETSTAAIAAGALQNPLHIPLEPRGADDDAAPPSAALHDAQSLLAYWTAMYSEVEHRLLELSWPSGPPLVDLGAIQQSAARLWNQFRSLKPDMQPQPPSSPVAQEAAITGARVLVVDDSPLDRQLIHHILTLRHYSVECVATPEDTILALSRADYDILLIDMKLPRGEEGIDLIVRLRSQGMNKPIVLVTAHGSVPAAVRSLHAGATDVVEKGESFSEILSHVMCRALQSHVVGAMRRERLTQLWTEVQTAADSALKGRVLEVLVQGILDSVEGLRTLANVRTATEEIDILVAIHRGDHYWANQGSHFLVECKNWSSHVGKNELVQFREKVTNRYGRCKLGLLVCPGEFATTVSDELLRGSKGETLIALVGKDDLAALATSDNPELILRGIIDKAVAT